MQQLKDLMSRDVQVINPDQPSEKPRNICAKVISE